MAEEELLDSSVDLQEGADSESGDTEDDEFIDGRDDEEVEADSVAVLAAEQPEELLDGSGDEYIEDDESEAGFANSQEQDVSAGSCCMGYVQAGGVLVVLANSAAPWLISGDSGDGQRVANHQAVGHGSSVDISAVHWEADVADTLGQCGCDMYPLGQVLGVESTSQRYKYALVTIPPPPPILRNRTSSCVLSSELLSYPDHQHVGTVGNVYVLMFNPAG
jgi:hypothetical protein